MHSAGFIHGDIKPGNILVGLKSIAEVLDRGEEELSCLDEKYNKDDFSQAKRLPTINKKKRFNMEQFKSV